MTVCQKEKYCSSVESNNVSKSIMHHSYNSYFKIIMTVNEEQTSNCEAAGKSSISWANIQRQNNKLAFTWIVHKLPMSHGLNRFLPVNNWIIYI